MKTEEILNEREKTHGDFERVANLYNALKMDVGWSLDEKVGERKITYKHILPIDMILLKLARIVCGDPNFADHWDDIAGYAMLGKGKKETRKQPVSAAILDKEYCFPLGSGKGVIDFWKEGEAILDKDCKCITFNGQHHHTCEKYVKEELKEWLKSEWKPLEKCKCFKCGDPYMGIPAIKGLCCSCIWSKEEPKEDSHPCSGMLFTEVLRAKECKHESMESWIAYALGDDPTSGVAKNFFQCKECNYVTELIYVPRETMGEEK